MKDLQLIELLNQLHSELGEKHNLDPESRKLLEDLAKDIGELLKNQLVQQEIHKDVVTRLEESIAQFEVTHPDLVTTISKILEGLSNVGI